jgi:TolA-binding protein
MARGAVILLSCAALANAPFQCASEPDPTKAMEDTPGEALYKLAEQFKASGDERAWRRTLEYLIARYPSSRFAAAARDDLERTQGVGTGGAP